MNSTRLSALFLAVAALAGAFGVMLPSAFGVSGQWSDALRVVCLAAIVAFVVSFIVALDKRALLRR